VNLLKDPHFLSREPYVEVDDFNTGEKRKMLGIPVKIKGAEFKPNNPPALGRDTDELLKQVGYSESEVKAFHEKGLVQ